MGLKYSVYLTPMRANDLRERLLANPDASDKTHIMLEVKRFDEQRADEWKKSVEAKSKATVGELEQFFAIRPSDPEVKEYYEDRHKDEILYLETWFMDAPFAFADGWTVGGHTGVRGIGSWSPEGRQINSYVPTFMLAAGVTPIYEVSYHHGSNDGGVSILSRTSPANPVMLKGWDGKDIKMEYVENLKSEEERYERYAKRVTKKTGAPIQSLHQYMEDLDDVVPWEHLVRWGKRIGGSA